MSKIIIGAVLMGCFVFQNQKFLAQMPKTSTEQTSVAYSLPKEAAGVAVSSDGRVFLALPRGGENHDQPSVVEMKGQKMVAFPNEEINKNTTENPAQHLVSVLGITINKDINWILDQGKRAGIDGIPHGATKIVGININSGKIVKNIPISKRFFRETMQLNDLRFDPTHGKEGTVYISNNGFAKPDQSLIIADVASGNLREVFKDIPEVSPEPGFIYFVEGKPHLLNYDHPTMPQGGGNGIELSKDYKTLYWTTPTNPDFYSIPTGFLSNFKTTEKDLRTQPYQVLVINLEKK